MYMESTDLITVEVAYARPERQLVLRLEVPRGTNAEEAIRLSGIAQHFTQLELADAPIGVFGRKVERDYVLDPGDRIEIYRPLEADPKEVRRQLAALGKTMGQRED